MYFKTGALAVMAAIAVPSTVLAQSFEGFQMGAGIASQQYKINGGPILNIPAGTVATTYDNDSNSKTPLILNLAYGFRLGPVLTTIGLDYTPSSSTVRNNDTTAVPAQFLDTKVKNRIGIYFAPGIEIDELSMAYVKLGYEHASVSTTAEDGSKPAGGPNSHGYSYGLGYKRFFGKGSRFYGVGEYTESSFGSADFRCPNGSCIADWGKLKSKTLALGIGYAF